jgi:hypothetical protein
MKEMLDEIIKKWEAKLQELDSCKTTIADSRTEINIMKKDLQSKDNELIELKSRWDKAEKMFTKI